MRSPPASQAVTAGWKRFYLQWHGGALPSTAALCPGTTELLENSFHQRGNVYTLPPGSLHYHLCLISPDCYIIVDGQKYHWQDREAMMFDETYRVILFRDIERPLSNPVL